MEKQETNDIGEKIEYLTSLSLKLSDLLKDPTNGGTIQLEADKRNALREEAHDKLCLAIESLSSLANFYYYYNSLINIDDRDPKKPI